jgi:hypothetical protein
MPIGALLCVDREEAWLIAKAANQIRRVTGRKSDANWCSVMR